MKAKDVYKIVSSRLQDLQTTRRWQWENPADDTVASLQDFLNNALLNVALQRPDSTATMKDLALTTGPRQVLEDTDLSLLECIKNKGGRAVTRIDRDEMDAFLVDWYEENGTFDGVWNWAYDKMMNPLVYWVYPAIPDDGDTYQLEAVVSVKPTKVTAPEDDLDISPLFKPAVEAWMLFEIMASDTEEANWQKALQYFQTFGQILGVKMQVDRGFPVRVQKNEGVISGD